MSKGKIVDVKDVLKTAFTDIENSPVAFQNSKRVQRYVEQELGIKLTLRQVQDYERRYVRPNQINRDVRGGHKPSLPYSSTGLDVVWQMDLVDLHKKNRSPNAPAFLLTKIDVFSRQVDAEPVLNKSAFKVVEAFDSICKRNGRWPAKLQTDEGKEFLNSIFKGYCKRFKIHHYVVNSEKKAAVIERFNRDLQKTLTRYRQHSSKTPFKSLVRAAVKNINNLPHSAHNLKPSSITPRIGAWMSKLILSKEDELAKQNRQFQKKFKFKKGDHVRTVQTKTPFSKAYRGTYTPEVFEIVERLRRKPHYHINLYKLKDLTGEPISGVYYEYELQRVFLTKEKVVERIVKKNKKGKLVKLLDYPDSYREWR